MLVPRKAAAVLLALAALGDLAGLLHQVTSHDQPPVPAMALGGVLGVVGLAMVRPLSRGVRSARSVAAATRFADVLLIGGAAASGHVFNEDCAHSIPAVSQFLISLAAAIALVLMERPLVSLTSAATEQ